MSVTDVLLVSGDILLQLVPGGHLLVGPEAGPQQAAHLPQGEGPGLGLAHLCSKPVLPHVRLVFQEENSSSSRSNLE